MELNTPRSLFTIEIEDANKFVKEIKKFVKENDITIIEAIELLKHLAYERRTDVLIENGDFEDLQTSEIATELNNISNNIEKVFFSLDKMAFK